MSRTTDGVPLSEVTNIRGFDDGQEEPVAKRAKTLVPDQDAVLTYELIGHDMSFQLCLDNTLYDLCDLLCVEWMDNFRGNDCGVDDHCWNFRDTFTHHRYESPNGMPDEDCGYHPISKLLANGHTIGSELKFQYDYGTTQDALLRLKSIVKDPQLAAQCPKRYEIPMPPNYQPHVPPEGILTVDDKFPHLSKALFQGGTQQPQAFHIFQPGRKHHHAFASSDNDGCLVLAWLPERMSSVEELMFALDKAFSRPISGEFEWEERIVYPHYPGTCATTLRRWKKLRNCRSSYYRANVFRCEDWNNQEEYRGYFSRAFPKCNNAYMAKRATERGWMSYKNGVLKLCRGFSKTPKWSNAPDVFQAGDQFEPTEGSVVATIQQKFTSLQELFCAAEALWP